MNVLLSRIHFPVTTLGYGRRIGIWTQGCHIRCPGCVSRDTWDPEGGFSTSITDLFQNCHKWFDSADGVTLSGGEPFEQPEALLELLSLIRSSHPGDILVFSGFEREALLSQPVVTHGLVDVLVSGPYRSEAGQTLTLRGSDNQRIDLLTPLARERYPADIDRRLWESPRRMDFFPTDNTLFMAGIPEPGWGENFRTALAARGFACRTSEQ
jgi:anaerobic ribonucleoside-triphosphate reductase activating protein